MKDARDRAIEALCDTIDDLRERVRQMEFVVSLQARSDHGRNENVSATPARNALGTGGTDSK